MLRLLCPLFLLGLTAGLAAEETISVSPGDWPWWRGPQRNGVAQPGQTLPETWSASENVKWSSPVPGRGHGSPTVVGDQVFLATADEQEQSQWVLCYDRAHGGELWRREIHRGQWAGKLNEKASMASGSVACDGERLFINFFHDGAAWATALNRGDGEILWQTKVSDYVVHQGYGASPAVYGPLVIITADNKTGGAVAGLNRETGEIVWKQERPKLPNYASPVILTAAGREQLVVIGCDKVASYDPLKGELLWETAGSTTECVTSTVTDGNLVFTSGGYPKNHVSAITADGSNRTVWENTSRVYVPSMLIKDGYLYAVADAGVAICWKAATGEEIWKGRLGGTFSASPVLVGDTVYATSEAGETFRFKADPQKFELLGKNKLGEEVFATPTICGNCLYFRVAEQKDGRRQEMLYCISAR